MAERVRPTVARVDLGVVRLAPGADAEAVRGEVQKLYPEGDVLVLSRQELIDRERHFWWTNTPIGFAFTGLVAERGGISAAFAADGGLGLACCAILAAWWLRMRARLDPLARVAEQQIAYAPADSFAGGGSTP